MGVVVVFDWLLDGCQLWCGLVCQGLVSDYLVSGYLVLDVCLFGGGWLVSGLCEVLQVVLGVGELVLVWLVLVRLSQCDCLIVLVVLFYCLYVLVWVVVGLDLGQLQIIYVVLKQVLWVVEQCLCFVVCVVVLCWLY